MMKRKGVVRLLALGLIGSMLAGCGGGAAETGTAETGTVTQESTAETTQEDVASADGLKTLDLYIDFPWYHSDHWNGIIPDAITEATGVTFNVTRSADDSQLGLMIASGELPDVIFCANEIDRLSDSNMCYGYNELIDQYGIDWAPDSERIAIARTHNVIAEDPNYYTIIQNYNTREEESEGTVGVPGIAGLYYRKDIWEALGSPDMNTIAQIKDVFAMVKENYPEMDVINAGGSGWRLAGFSNWYGANYEFLYQEDGSISYVDASPEFYNYLKCTNEFYRNGYYTEENLALTVEADAMQQAYNGDCFIYEWNARPNWLVELNTKTQEYLPDAEWGYLPIPDDSEEITYSNAGWAGVFISKNCKDPEAAIKLISYLNSEEGQNLSQWGREGIDYELDKNGLPQFSEEWKDANKDSSVMAEMYNTNFLSTTEKHERYSFYSGRDQEMLDVFSKNADKIVARPELALSLPKANSDEGIIRSKIEEARKAERVKLYTASSEEEFEELYQDYIQLLEKMGVQQLEDTVTDSLKNIKEQFGF